MREDSENCSPYELVVGKREDGIEGDDVSANADGVSKPGWGCVGGTVECSRPIGGDMASEPAKGVR